MLTVELLQRTHEREQPPTQYVVTPMTKPHSSLALKFIFAQFFSFHPPSLHYFGHLAIYLVEK